VDPDKTLHMAVHMSQLVITALYALAALLLLAGACEYNTAGEQQPSGACSWQVAGLTSNQAAIASAQQLPAIC
jgi:hypothetical protein